MSHANYNHAVTDLEISLENCGNFYQQHRCRAEREIERRFKAGHLTKEYLKSQFKKLVQIYVSEGFYMDGRGDTSSFTEDVINSVARSLAYDKLEAMKQGDFIS